MDWRSKLAAGSTANSGRPRCALAVALLAIMLVRQFRAEKGRHSQIFR